MTSFRPPAVAGLFYPGEAAHLSRDVHTMLESADKTALSPKALIVPHAGYIYSGPIAASAYASLEKIASRIRRVVLLGPAHRIAVRGLALPEASTFVTPLGEVKLDMETMYRLERLPLISINARAHALEHSLEVHLPFLQTILHDFSLIPLVVGVASAEEVAEILDELWGGNETLIVISSDLSHYLPYPAAQAADRATADAILHLQQGITHDQACGATPVNGLLLAARRRGMRPTLLDLRNSGDTAGSKDGVVGYAAFAFEEHAP